MHVFKNIARILAVLALLPIIGMVGFHYIEGWNLFDSLYMSMITLSTVGYQEVHPLSNHGRTFVMIYLVIGLGLFLFSVAQVGEMVVRGNLIEWFGRKRMNKSISDLTGHYIVCGLGRVGQGICEHLASKSIAFVGIDSNEQALKSASDKGWMVLEGDATDDDILKSAGVHKAKALAAVLGGDAENVFVVLSARLMAKDLEIVARASDDSSAKKLTKAGANRVVSLLSAGATRMAHLLINSRVLDFSEFVSSEGEFDMAEIKLSTRSQSIGLTLRDLNLTPLGLMIFGVRQHGRLIIPPPESTKFGPNDSLLAVGPAAAIEAFANQQ